MYIEPAYKKTSVSFGVFLLGGAGEFAPQGRRTRIRRSRVPASRTKRGPCLGGPEGGKPSGWVVSLGFRVILLVWGFYIIKDHPIWWLRC